MMWVLKKKYNEMRELLKFKARATVRGDQESAVDRKLGLPAEETFAPTTRHNTIKCRIAAGCCQAACAKPGAPPPRYRTFDVDAAFLTGSSLSGRPRYVRPPEGYRTYDRRGVPIVWEMMGNCYGRAVAPRIFNQTFHKALVEPEASGGVGMTQSLYDPCFYYKIYADGTRMDICLYVDDAWLYDNAGEKADADLARLNGRFKLKITEKPSQFLNMNVHVLSPTRVKLTSEAYVLSMADKYVPKWREHARVSMPATESLLKAYDVAQQRERVPSKSELQSYRGKIGALIYTSPCTRPDACCAIGRLARAQTFPTPELEAMADQVIVYLAQTATVGITFDGSAEGASQLRAATDSDWAVGHSTTGWACILANATFAYASKRQQCIALSSTEAEIIAASACAVELTHFRGLLKEMGLPQNEPSPIDVDNSGAVELSRDLKSCHRSRHVDRRYFKVRELTYEGEVAVRKIDTKLNPADVLTKPLPQDAFDRHVKTLMNLE